MSNIYLVEIDGRDPVTGDKETVRLTTARDFSTRPDETPKNAAYRPNVLGVGTYVRAAFGDQATLGDPTVGFGEVRLANGRRSRSEPAYLDRFRDHVFAGRRIVVRKGRDRSARELSPARYPDDYPAVFTGIVRAVEWGLGEVVFRIKDRQGERAAKTLQETIYAGDNILPDGVEGGADLEGQYKPLLIGRAFNFAPPLVNTSTVTYQLSTRPVAALDGVYDRGAAIAAGTTHASLAALQAATVGAGTYDFYPGDDGDGAFIRVETQPEALTVDAAAGDTATDRTIGALVEEILIGIGGVPANEVSGIAALKSAVSHEAGMWIGLEAVTYGEALSTLLGSVQGWWLDSRAGIFEVARLSAPNRTAAKGVVGEDHAGDRASDIQSVTNVPPDDGLVPRAITVGFRRNHLVQSETAPAAGTRTPLVRDEYQTRRREMAAAADYPIAEDVRVDTAFADAAGADWFLDNFQALYGERREILQVSVHPSVAAGWNIGDTLTLRIDRFDWWDKPVRLIGYREELGNGNQGGRTLLTLWG